MTVLRMWGGNIAENTFQITSLARRALSSSSIPQAGRKVLTPYKGRLAVWIQWASSTLTRLILHWNPLHLHIRNLSCAKCPAEDLNSCSTVMMRCCTDPALQTVMSWTLAYRVCEHTGQLKCWSSSAHVPPIYITRGVFIDCDSWYLKTRVKVWLLGDLKPFERRNGDRDGSAEGSSRRRQRAIGKVFPLPVPAAIRQSLRWKSERTTQNCISWGTIVDRVLAQQIIAAW